MTPHLKALTLGALILLGGCQSEQSCKVNNHLAYYTAFTGCIISDVPGGRLDDACATQVESQKQYGDKKCESWYWRNFKHD